MLALEQGYESLTIRMVTERAIVGYSTLYRHYLSLNDLLIQVLTAALQELKEWALQATTPQGETLAMYTYIKAQPVSLS